MGTDGGGGDKRGADWTSEILNGLTGASRLSIVALMLSVMIDTTSHVHAALPTTRLLIIDIIERRSASSKFA